jgi:hypothetical protein
MTRPDPSQQTRLRTERLADGKRELLSELRRESCGATIVVPDGFQTDYSSIPFWARFVVRWSRVDVAGVVHDWCYHVGLQDESGRPSRALSDRIWRDIARRGQSRANALQAWVCWTGLWLGGWCAWNKSRARDAQGSRFRAAYLASLENESSRIA